VGIAFIVVVVAVVIFVLFLILSINWSKFILVLVYGTTLLVVVLFKFAKGLVPKSGILGFIVKF
jgi:hypothetical protein